MSSGGQSIGMRWSGGDTAPLYTSVWSVDSDINDVKYRAVGPLSKLTLFYHKNRNAVLLGVGIAIVVVILLLGFSWHLYHKGNVQNELVLTDTGILEVVSSSRLIKFNQGTPSSYKKYTDYIDHYLTEYNNNQKDTSTYINCTGKINWNSLSLDFIDPSYEGKKCHFPVQTGGRCSQNVGFYGYHEGEPCILLKLNKLPPSTYPGWEADPMDPSQLSVKFSETQRHHLHEHKVAIICQGRDYADKENIQGSILYFPQSFSKEYFRGAGHIADPAPLIFIQLTHPMDGTLISMRCEAWGIPEDAINDTTNKVLIGRVTFELLMD